MTLCSMSSCRTGQIFRNE
uniref:Uncharacterized protein n=1 Tax=Anguilla anguilla TaxID=7936 RepID=A0A0E9VUU0_ANGAN